MWKSKDGSSVKSWKTSVEKLRPELRICDASSCFQLSVGAEPREPGSPVPRPRDGLYLTLSKWFTRISLYVCIYRTQVSLVRSMCLVSVSNWVSDVLWNFTDVTLADVDTNWILTDNDKKAFQGNVAMWLNLVANFGSDHFFAPSPKRRCWNLTDVTLADEDTNSILTDKGNMTIQGNVAMQL